MDTMSKIKLLEIRLHKLSVRDRNNYGVRRKIMREIRNLQKELDEQLK